MDHLEITVRILASVILGFFLGFQRTKHHKPAGIRTHSLVAMGSCLITLVGAYGFWEFSTNRDAMRVAAQIVSGVGFIGAGIIYKQRADEIRGITTAASIWVSAGIGIACAAGMYYPAILVALLVMFVYKAHLFLIRFGIIEQEMHDSSQNTGCMPQKDND